MAPSGTLRLPFMGKNGHEGIRFNSMTSLSMTHTEMLLAVPATVLIIFNDSTYNDTPTDIWSLQFKGVTTQLLFYQPNFIAFLPFSKTDFRKIPATVMLRKQAACIRD